MKTAIIVCFRCGYILAVGILFKLKNRPFYSRVLSRQAFDLSEAEVDYVVIETSI